MHDMETDANAVDAFAVPDDYDDDMVDHDTGGDDRDCTDWSERAVGHAAREGNF